MKSFRNSDAVCAVRRLVLAAAVGLLTACATSGGSGMPKPPAPMAKPAAAAGAPAPSAKPAPTPAAAPSFNVSPTAAVPTAAADAPQPGTDPNTGSAAPAQTPEERRVALERRLDASLGSFDRDLSAERERLAKERDARAAQAGSAVTEGPAAGATASNGTGRAGSRPAGSRPGDLHSERGAREEQGKKADTAGNPSNNPNGAAGRNIPDGSDDDIVARRLRKAAEAETDPELKERLWQEYIEYKRSGQNKS